jgi:hypothetical protein
VMKGRRVPAGDRDAEAENERSQERRNR